MDPLVFIRESHCPFCSGLLPDADASRSSSPVGGEAALLTDPLPWVWVICRPFCILYHRAQVADAQYAADSRNYRRQVSFEIPLTDANESDPLQAESTMKGGVTGQFPSSLAAKRPTGRTRRATRRVDPRWEPSRNRRAWSPNAVPKRAERPEHEKVAEILVEPTTERRGFPGG